MALTPRLVFATLSQSIPDKKGIQIYPTSATPHLPTVRDVKEFISSLKVAAVELLDEHVESLLDLMVYDGTVEKLMVQNVQRDRNGGGPDAKKKKRKRKGAASGSDTEAESDAERPKKKRKAKTNGKGKAANGKGKGTAVGKKRRAADSEDSEGSSDAEFDSDEDVETARSRNAAAGKSKKRRKDRKRRGDSKSNSDAGGGSDSDGQTSESSKAGSDSDDDAKPDIATSANDYVYRLIRPYKPRIGWTDMPCGKCPVESFCSEPARPLGPHHRQGSSFIGLRIKPPTAGGPRIPIEMSGQLQGVGMMGGVGAAIGASNEKWGDVQGAVGFGVAPVNPRDCSYFKAWLDF